MRWQTSAMLLVGELGFLSRVPLRTVEPPRGSPGSCVADPPRSKPQVLKWQIGQVAQGRIDEWLSAEINSQPAARAVCHHDRHLAFAEAQAIMKGHRRPELRVLRGRHLHGVALATNVSAELTGR